MTARAGLGLADADPPNFLTSPGQVGFTPDGRKLIVTTKASRSTIDVYRVRRDGRLSENPVVNPSATPVPFAFTFDRFGRLVSGEAGASSVTTYTIERDGDLYNAQSLSDNQAALCWIVPRGASSRLEHRQQHAQRLPDQRRGDAFARHAERRRRDDAGWADRHGRLSQGNFLYAQTGTAGTVEEYHVERDGTLTLLGSVTGLPPGMEGIAAT
jgi:hypothetical protein